jgi:hypothetical protein
MNQTLIDVIALQVLFSDKKHWTFNAPARTAKSKWVDPLDPTACRWCLIGGVDFVTGRDKTRRDALGGELIGTYGGYTHISIMQTLMQVNDDEGYKFVKLLVDNTVARVRMLESQYHGGNIFNASLPVEG